MQQSKKITIKELIVVEGKTDTAKLKKIYNVDTIETNGLSLSNKKINDIIQLSKHRGVIFFLDPDGPGEKIRNKLIQHIPNSKNCFLERKKYNYNVKKIGVAEANDNEIIEALKKVVTFNSSNDSLTWEEFILLDIDSVSKRLYLCNKLNISYCNNKQLFKRINMLNKSFVDIKNIINQWNTK